MYVRTSSEGGQWAAMHVRGNERLVVMRGPSDRPWLNKVLIID